MKEKAKKSKNKKKDEKKYEGNAELMVSTGSTLLDLAISGGRKRGGGIPGGIFVEIFGPSGAGKTVLLCEIAGAVQRKGGEVMFKDPEARLNKQFAQIFDLDVNHVDYDTPNTVPEVFRPIRAWEPEDTKIINGVFADSLAALSTNLEMSKEEGDKMGMRRAKEFSEELRRTCRILTERNMLLVASNQLRTNTDAGPFGRKHTAPGGNALEFYACLRLRLVYTTKIKKKKTYHGKKIQKVIGIETEIEVDKSSVWEPHHTAPLTILFDYGIDDVRDCLQFVKDYSKENVYTLGGEKLHNNMDKAIAMVEEQGEEAIQALKVETIDLWETIQEKFKTERKPKVR
jgi:recombination protein RecA